MRKIGSFLRRSFYLVFGILAILAGTIILAWIAYNICASILGETTPVIKDKMASGKFFFLFEIIGVTATNYCIIQVGLLWINKSEVINFLKSLKN